MFFFTRKAKAGALIALLALIAISAMPAVAGVGGGFTNGGIQGQYFNNTTLTAPAAFTRQDVRVNFTWGTTLPPGGSNSVGYKTIGTTNYTVQWTGAVIPRFSETYTFKTITSGGVKLNIRQTGQPTWNTIINNWTVHTQTTDSGTFAMTAGTSYDIQMQYLQTTGSATAILHWASPSTPEENIEAMGNQGSNLDEYRYSGLWADAMKNSRDEWKDMAWSALIPRDSNGWPTQDGTCMVWEGVTGMDGTYLVQFNGKAVVTCPFTNYGTFWVGATNYGTTLPSGAGYNAGTNTTTATMVITHNSLENFIMGFSSTQRTSGSGTNTGVTNVQLMRPISEGSTTYYDPSLIFTNQIESTFAPFSAFRWLGANFSLETNWADRCTPLYSSAHKDSMGTNGAEDIPWEYLVKFANETGKDLWITIPELATGATSADTTSYVYQLAQLILNGDTVNGTFWPGLNSNLKLYFEYSNEVWNFTFTAWGQNYNAALNDESTNNANGVILKYDGNTDANIGWNRRCALRTKQASDIFRAVWGDAAMPGTSADPRVRPCLEPQYDDGGWPATTETQLQLLDNYFNNGDGNHVGTPHPLSYYLWADGGATYYDASNNLGTLGTIVPANNSFESGTTGWTFTGNAGVVANGNALGNPNAPNGTNAAYIGDTGSISQSVNFTGAGIYVVNVQMSSAGTSDPIDFYLDGTRITPGGGTFDYLAANAGPIAPGGGNYSQYSSFLFTLGGAGSHTIKFAGTGAAGSHAFLDLVQIGSVDGLFGADIPATSTNSIPTVSQADFILRSRIEANWAKRYGLRETSYEGGWGLGGDNGGYPIQNYAKYVDARAKTAQMTADDILNQAGIDLQFWGTYASWLDSSNPAASPLYQGFQDRANHLAAEPNNGISEPNTTLVEANKTLSINDVTGTISNFGWIDWNIIVPSTGNYTVSATTGAGGNVRLSVDDANTIATGASGGTLTGSIFLTKGLHTVIVRATNGTFAVSNATVTTGAPTIPSPPTGLTATAGNTQVALTWNASSGATSYNVLRSTVSGSGYASVATGIASTSYTNTGLTNGTTYYFVVTATNSAGTSGNSAQASATPTAGSSIPPAPTGLTATPGNAQIALSWTASTGATSYNVLRSTVNGSGYVSIATGIATTSYTNTGLTNGTTYYFVVTATNSFGTSGNSNQASATPSAGGGGGNLLASEPFAEATGALNGANGGSGWSAAWVEQNGNNTVPGYNVASGALTYSTLSTSANHGTGGLAYEGSGRGLDISAGGPFGANGYLTGGLIGASGKTLWFSALIRKDTATDDENSFKLHNGSGSGVWNPTPALVGMGYFGAASNNGATRYWSLLVAGTTYQTNVPITVGTTTLLVMQIQFGATNTVSLYVNPSSLGGAAPAATITQTTASSLAFQSMAYFGGNGASQSSIDEIRFGDTYAIVTPTSGGSAPPAPTGLTATPGNAQVALSWTASTGATSYNVLRSTVNGSGYASVATGIAVTNYTNTGLTNGTTYYFVVTATNSTGTSGNSNQASATPQPGIPPAPTGLTATPGNAQVALSWTASSGATSYNVKRSTVNGSGYATISSPAGTSLTDTGLTNGTTYYYVVTAVNSAGESGNSNQASTTPQVSAPAAPTGLTATPGNAQVALAWTASSGATSYNVLRSTVNGSGYASVATGIAVTNYTNTGLTNGTTYYFVVTATNAGGTSGNSNQASATPSAGGGGITLATEPFAEATGALHNANGGTGWGGAWFEQNSSTTVPGYNVASGSMSYSTLTVSGNHGVGGFAYESAGRLFDVTAGGPFGTNGYVSGGLIGVSGKTLWMSALIRKDSNFDDENSLRLTAGGTVWQMTTPLVGIGYFGAASNNGATREWSLNVNGTVIQTTVPVVVGTTALLVVRIDYGATNTVTLYVNPASLGGSAPGTSSASGTTATNIAFKNLVYYGANGAGGSSIDEIRYGTTYASVTQ